MAVREVRQTAASLAPTMPVLGARTISRALHGLNGLLLFELAAAGATALGSLGLVLALVGIYGVTVSLLLAGAASLAAYVPARPAMRVDPTVVLRCE